MTIKPDENCKKAEKWKTVLFRDILDVYVPKEPIKHTMPKNWQHGLYLQTTERLFFLCAKSEEDRNMWMAGFRYLLASTLTVQNIMKDNSKILEQKIKERTKKMLDKNVSQTRQSITKIPTTREKELMKLPK